MDKNPELLRQVGQRFVTGFHGYSMDQEFMDIVREFKIGNVILFSRNVQNFGQLRRLCGQIREFIWQQTGQIPFIMIDQEGGTVSRLNNDELNVPGEMALAETRDMQLIRRAAQITAQELMSCGINLNLAPVLDVNSNPDNPVIGARSYGEYAQEVTECGVNAVQGYLDENFLCCLKHFPGHGDTAVDSHLGLPLIDRSLDELKERELMPFAQAILAGAPAVMTTHILFPQLEKENIPATMSREIMTGLLRKQMKFNGLIISDCMEMQAIQKYYGTVEGAVAGIKAGVDLICISHTASLAAKAAEKIYDCVQDAEISQDEMRQAAERIDAVKAKCRKNMTKELTSEQNAVFKKEIATMRYRTIQWYKQDHNDIWLGTEPLFIGCADYRTALVSDQKDSTGTFPESMKKYAGCGTAFVTDQDPDGRKISQAVSLFRSRQGCTSVVYGMYNGHIKRGQLALGQALAAVAQERRIPMIAVTLRDPYDLRFMPENVMGIMGWEYSQTQFRQLWKFLSYNDVI
ncbi:MAG: beta-N-acetylhexosaminidase [Butyrivibrio sp.]|jgi:beta-N-acetylhexosaminidase|nr:beta-N-acetylhexosaminidase [Butyrivibrio sp.]